MQSIVLAVDGSAYSDAAAQCIAAGQLLRGPLQVHVVHCLPDVSGEVKHYISAADIQAWHSDESGRVMHSAADILRTAGVPFEQHALTGFAPERILAFARSVNAQAIVMGTHGRGAFLNAVVGSVAARVVADAPCPVVLVKAGTAR